MWLSFDFSMTNTYNTNAPTCTSACEFCHLSPAGSGPQVARTGDRSLTFTCIVQSCALVLSRCGFVNPRLNLYVENLQDLTVNMLEICCICGWVINMFNVTKIGDQLRGLDNNYGGGKLKCFYYLTGAMELFMFV